MKKILKFGEDAVNPIVAGVSKMCKVVGSTMGPHGKTVLIQRGYGFPKATRDGYTVARELKFSDQFEELGAAMMREASAKTNDVAGDGTTQTVVLASSIYSHGRDLIDKGLKVKEVKAIISDVSKAVIKSLEAQKKEVKTIEKLIEIAVISANEEKLGNDVAKAVWEAGKDGSVTIEDGVSPETTIDQTKGFRFDRPWVTPYFINDPVHAASNLEDVAVLVIGDKLESLYEIANILKAWNKAEKGSLLIIANEFSDDAVALLVQSFVKGTKVCAVKTPDFGEHRDRALMDIAAVTGAKLIGTSFGVPAKSITEANGLSVLGFVKKTIVNKDSTLFIEPSGTKENVDARIADAKYLLDNEESEYQKGKHRQRLGRLTGGVVIIKVGGSTDTEMAERKFRVEDAVAASQSAYRDGYLVGGGKSLLNAITSYVNENPDKPNHLELLASFGAPFKTIVLNAGEDWEKLLAQLNPLTARGLDFGYDAQNGVWTDLEKAGIVDPFKATEQAVLNSVSVASLLLSTSAGIVNEPEASDMPGQMPQM